VWSAPKLTKPTFDEAKRQTYKPAHKGESFGPSWVSADTRRWAAMGVVAGLQVLDPS